VLVLAHRREIITQTSDKLRANGIPHGIILAGVQPRPLEFVQVASIQTLWSRAVQRENMDLPRAELLVIDECHHCPAKTYRKIIDAYPNVILLGLTATPCRGDGRGLGGVFEATTECPQVGELIEQGYLVKTRVYAPVIPDLKGVRVEKGDYVESQLAERMDRPKLVGDIVTHWHRYGECRKTVCFATGVRHSVHLRDEFIKSGVRAEHIDGGTPKPERDASLARLASGEIELITNCMVLTEGWDMPEVGCCILARPTKKMGLYRQMIGRVLRPAKDKPDAIILDHSGAVFRHGFAEDHVEWTLDPDTRAESPEHKARCEEPKSRLLECSQCGCVRIAGEPCSNCGFLPTPPPLPFTVAAGDLGLVEGRRARASIYDPAERAEWHGMLTYIAIERGYSPKWPNINYKQKFSAWPPWGANPEPIPPTPEVRSWVRSRLIAYAKARGAA
jgi:superfamily II DNA or RNA helicase